MKINLPGKLISLESYSFVQETGEIIEGTRVGAVVFDSENGNQGKVLENVMEEYIPQDKIASYFKEQLPDIELTCSLSSKKVLKISKFVLKGGK